MGRENDCSQTALPHPARPGVSWVNGHLLHLEESKVTAREAVLLRLSV